MIRVNSKEVEFRGTKLGLMSEFTGLVHNLISSNSFTKDDIDLCVETAMLSNEELDDQLTENMRKFVEKLIKVACGEDDENNE